MTFEQAAIVLLLVCMLGLFAWGRLRIEIVALGGLALGVVLGLVPLAETFGGFANPAFITVVEILLIVQVLGRSGLLDRLLAPLPLAALSEANLVTLLCATGAVLSVFMNNIGALALMLPVVASVSRLALLDQRRVLMPVSFATLLGGLCSLIGTPANLLVSQQLVAQRGAGFAFFDFALVGVPVALAGLLVLRVWNPLARPGETGRPSPLPGNSVRRVVTEVLVPSGSLFAGMEPSQLPARLHTLERAGKRVMFQRPGERLEAGDLLLLETDLSTLEAWLAGGTLSLAGARPLKGDQGWVEAVIMPQSTLIGSRLRTLESFAARGIRIVAVASQSTRIEGSLSDLQLGIGDVLFLEGEEEAISEALEEAGVLPLWPRPPKPDLGKPWLAAGTFAGGVLLAASGLVGTEYAFGLVVLVLAALGSLNLRRALSELDWPILIMLAAMIPLGQAIETTGAAAVIAGYLVALLPEASPLLLLAAVLLLALVVTPFVNNASTAIALGPIAVGIAGAAALPPEPFLMAVAVGASIDFLTPIGHHNNTIVMGLAGYRFIDFLKAGWPLTLTTSLVAVPLLWLFWF